MGDYYPFRAYSDVWCSADGRRWERVTNSAPWPCRIWSSTAVYKNRLWLLGGFRSEPVWQNFGDVWYSIDGAQWTKLETYPLYWHSGNGNGIIADNTSVWAPRHEMSIYVLNDRLWVVGGMVWPLVNDVWALKIDGLTFVSQPVIEDFVGTQYEYHAKADFNNSCEPIYYRLIDSPSWLFIEPDTGFVYGRAEEAGNFSVTVEAYDSAGEQARQSYILHILPA